MTRLSGDEIRRGRVWNGFDYELQVWVADGTIQRCGHPHTMRLPENLAAMLIVWQGKAS